MGQIVMALVSGGVKISDEESDVVDENADGDDGFDYGDAEKGSDDNDDDDDDDDDSAYS